VEGQGREWVVLSVDEEESGEQVIVLSGVVEGAEDLAVVEVEEGGFGVWECEGGEIGLLGDSPHSQVGLQQFRHQEVQHVCLL
jgi:hypothetical protein